jgi:hypothetical protein
MSVSEFIDTLFGLSNGGWILYVLMLFAPAGVYFPSKWEAKELKGFFKGDEARLNLAVKVHHWPGMIFPIFAIAATMIAQFRPDGLKDDIWWQICLGGLALGLLVWGATLTVPSLASMKNDLKAAKLLFQESEASRFED